MSNAICEHIKKYPDFYEDKEPVIVKKLPDKRKIFPIGKIRGGFSCFIQNRLEYFLDKDGNVFRARLSKKGYNRILEVNGFDPEYEWVITPEEY